MDTVLDLKAMVIAGGGHSIGWDADDIPRDGEG
jgi:hypothetical protein